MSWAGSEVVWAQVIGTLCAALVSLLLEHCVQSQALPYKNSILLLEHAQRRATKLVKGLENELGGAAEGTGAVQSTGEEPEGRPHRSLHCLEGGYSEELVSFLR